MQIYGIITPPYLAFARPRAKIKEKERKILTNYYTTFVGDTIALSTCNKPLNL